MLVEVGCQIFFAPANFPSFNARDVMSAITLYLPAMLIGVRYDVFLSSCRSSKNRISLATGIGVEVLPLYLQATDGVFSQKLTMCLKFRSSTTY